ncbi:MAG: PEP-utilizing enzyme [bacterium]|nr:PEP-utilizing enzyme [bacterium]
MDSKGIITKVQGMKWERWLERPFHAFVFSLFEDSSRPESFEKIGIDGVELRTQFAQKGSWYLNNELMEEMDAQVEKYLRNHRMTDISNDLENFREVSGKKIKSLLISSDKIDHKFATIYEILKTVCTYIWLAHGVESYYNRVIKQEVPKYIKGDIDKFVGDAGFPKKKNAYAKFKELMRSNASDEEIASQYGWLKPRFAFTSPFTAEEIKKMRTELAPEQDRANIEIPKELQDLFNEVQELVFFRTERTDVFYWLLFLARPIIQEMATRNNIELQEMIYFRAKSFLVGHTERYEPFSTFVYLDGDVLFQNDPIIEDETVSEKEEVRGAIAYPGTKRGVVKIVRDVPELNKVEVGDILVTQMTFPSFISAMNRAASFVTDEGGITCHAAIVAREMHKPCIVGTKIATKVLKDGDLVEVDANKGVVKIINRS